MHDRARHRPTAPAVASDTGIARNTAVPWLSVLESTFIAFRLPAWSPNVRLADPDLRLYLVYGGDRRHTRRGVEVLPWHAVGDVGADATSGAGRRQNDP